MNKQEVVAHLNRIAQLKALDGANRFSIGAYQNAAKKIEGVKVDKLEDMTGLEGVGAKTALAIEQFIETGTSDTYQELLARIPAAECLTMTVVAGIGPKKALAFWKQGIRNFDELVTAAEAGKLDSAKVEKAVLFARDVGTGRTPRGEAFPVAKAMLEAIRTVPGIVEAEVCGSFRRERDTVKDLDVVVAVVGKAAFKKIDLSQTDGLPARIAKTLKTETVFGRIAKALRDARVLVDVLNDGIVKREFRVIKHGVQIKADVWVVELSYWGSAIAYATGSKFHNVYLRDDAIGKGLKINEYGIFNRRTGDRLGGEHEQDIYDLLGIEWVEPRNRER